MQVWRPCWLFQEISCGWLSYWVVDEIVSYRRECCLSPFLSATSTISPSWYQLGRNATCLLILVPVLRWKSSCHLQSLRSLLSLCISVSFCKVALIVNCCTVRLCLASTDSKFWCAQLILSSLLNPPHCVSIGHQSSTAAGDIALLYRTYFSYYCYTALWNTCCCYIVCWYHPLSSQRIRHQSSAAAARD